MIEEREPVTDIDLGRMVETYKREFKAMCFVMSRHCIGVSTILELTKIMAPVCDKLSPSGAVRMLYKAICAGYLDPQHWIDKEGKNNDNA